MRREKTATDHRGRNSLADQLYPNSWRGAGHPVHQGRYVTCDVADGMMRLSRHVNAAAGDRCKDAVDDSPADGGHGRLRPAPAGCDRSDQDRPPEVFLGPERGARLDLDQNMNISLAGAHHRRLWQGKRPPPRGAPTAPDPLPAQRNRKASGPEFILGDRLRQQGRALHRRQRLWGRFAPNKKEVEGLLRSPPVKENSFIHGGSARRPVATRNDRGALRSSRWHGMAPSGYEPVDHVPSISSTRNSNDARCCGKALRRNRRQPSSTFSIRPRRSRCHQCAAARRSGAAGTRGPASPSAPRRTRRYPPWHRSRATNPE